MSCVLWEACFTTAVGKHDEAQGNVKTDGNVKKQTWKFMVGENKLGEKMQWGNNREINTSINKKYLQ